MALLISHRRNIKRLKFFSLAGITGIFYLFYLYLSAESSSIPLAVPTDSLPSSLPPEIEMALENSLLTGVDKDFQPYTVKADRASRLKNDNYNLDKVKVRCRLSRHDLLAEADSGVINNVSRKIVMNDNVQVSLENLIFSAPKMEMDLISKNLYGNSGVTVAYKNSLITADRFSASDESNILKFKGHVSSRITLSNF